LDFSLILLGNSLFDPLSYNLVSLFHPSFKSVFSSILEFAFKSSKSDFSINEAEIRKTLMLTSSFDPRPFFDLKFVYKGLLNSRTMAMERKLKGDWGLYLESYEIRHLISRFFSNKLSSTGQLTNEEWNVSKMKSRSQMVPTPHCASFRLWASQLFIILGVFHWAFLSRLN